MIELLDDYVILIDPLCYVLAKCVGTDKNGRERFRNLTYHNSVQKAFHAFYRELVKKELSDGLHTVCTALHTIQEVSERVEALIDIRIPDV